MIIDKFLRGNREKLNTLTKYPSIETYHKLGERGRLLEERNLAFDGPVLVTEKVDGTNARIIVDASGDYVVGAREIMLAAKGDRHPNPQDNLFGVLSAFFAEGLFPVPSSGVRCFYGEVYGGKIGKEARQYSVRADVVAYRLFDVCDIPNPVELAQQPLEMLSTLRESQRYQQWFPEQALLGLATRGTTVNLELTPRLALKQVPESVGDTFAWLSDYAHSKAAFEDGAGALSEGVVVRTADRGQIAKIRFEEYRKTLQRVK